MLVSICGLGERKKSFDWDIILENIALFANTFFLIQNLGHGLCWEL